MKSKPEKVKPTKKTPKTKTAARNAGVALPELEKLEPIDEAALKRMPESQILNRLKESYPAIQNTVENTVYKIYHCLRLTSAAGQMLEELARRYRGEWAKVLPIMIPGLPLRTADLWRSQWRNLKRVNHPNGEPDPTEYVKAYRRAGCLPKPDPYEPNPDHFPAPYRFYFKQKEHKPIENWGSENWKIFLRETEPILKLREQAEKLLNSRK